MFKKCSSRSETRADVNSKSHLAIERWPSEPSVGENESSSIAAIDNGHMSGYRIGLLYRRIRGRLSCQSAYRAPLINPRKRSLLSFLTWHGVCGNQPSPALDARLCLHVHLHPSLVFCSSSHYLFPPSPLFVFRPPSVVFFFFWRAWVENFQLAERRHVQHRSSFAWLPQAMATRSSHAICSNQKLSIYPCVALIQGEHIRAKLLLNNWACLAKTIKSGQIRLFYLKLIDGNLIQQFFLTNV